MHWMEERADTGLNIDELVEWHVELAFSASELCTPSEVRPERDWS